MADNFLPFKNLRQLFFMHENQTSASLTVECLLCKKCLKVMRTSSTNLKKHLQRIHPNEYAEYQSQLLEPLISRRSYSPQQLPESRPLLPERRRPSKESCNAQQFPEPQPVPLENTKSSKEEKPTITFQGTIWAETSEMIVVNVLYKEHMFSGALMKSSSADWIPSSNENFQQRMTRTAPQNFDNCIVTRSAAHKTGSQVAWRRSVPPSSPLASLDVECVVSSHTRFNTKRKSEAVEQQPDHFNDKKKKVEDVRETPSESLPLPDSLKCSQDNPPNDVADNDVVHTPSATEVSHLQASSIKVEPVEELLRNDVEELAEEKQSCEIKTEVLDQTNPDTPESLRELGLSLPYGNIVLEHTKDLQPKIHGCRNSCDEKTLTVDTSTLASTTPNQTTFPSALPDGPTLCSSKPFVVKEHIEQPLTQQGYCNPHGYLLDYPYYGLSGVDSRLNPSSPHARLFSNQQNLYPNSNNQASTEAPTPTPTSYCGIPSFYPSPYYNYGLPGPYSAYTLPYPLLTPYSTPEAPRHSYPTNLDFEMWRYYSSAKVDDKSAEAPVIVPVSPSSSEGFKSGQSDGQSEETAKLQDGDLQQPLEKNEASYPDQESIEVLEVTPCSLD